MYWRKDIECMDREELIQLQLERLQATLFRVSRNVPLYRARFEEHDIDPDSFLSVDDLTRIPFTTKADIRENYPYGLFAVPLREVVRLHSSSGTSGRPVVVGYTRNDVKQWSDLDARILCMAGLDQDDVLQIAFSYGLFTGGFGHHYGAERLGASVIPSSSGNTKKQLAIMQDYRTTALACTPSYALHLADVMEEEGINPNALTLRWGLFGAEAWSENMRREIESRLKITATDNYGLSEIMGPGVAGECLEQGGLHVNEDAFLFEIVNPDTGEPVPDGEVGELVITTLTKEAFPMIRFRTGDLTRRIVEPCPCGRTHHRISRILGRVDDMITIKGVNVFPSQVEQILMDAQGAVPRFQIVVERDAGHLDRATIHLEVSESILFDQMRESQEFLASLKKRLASELGVGFEVSLVGKRTLPRGEEKMKRVIDKRTF